jgi:hypothetical protein
LLTKGILTLLLVKFNVSENENQPSFFDHSRCPALANWKSFSPTRQSAGLKSTSERYFYPKMHYLIVRRFSA